MYHLACRRIQCYKLGFIKSSSPRSIISSPRDFTTLPQAMPTSFDEFFSTQFGTSRWQTLSDSLAEPTTHCALVNSFLIDNDNNINTNTLYPDSFSSPPRWSSSNYIPLIPREYPKKNINDTYPPPPSMTSNNHNKDLLAWYWMDPASLLPPLALSIDPKDTVLDMCAAPGGKSLALAQLLFNNTATTTSNHHPLLVCNEIDYKRRQRLHKVLDQYIPDIILQNIHITGLDGTKWSTLCQDNHKKFDKILLDAPCSSDRHVVQQKKSTRAVSTADWNVKRCNYLAKEQYKLLLSALECLNVNGRVVYSTCSMAEMQNDGVVEKVLNRIAEQQGQQEQHAVEVVSHQLAGNSNSSSGFITVEDIEERFGAERTQHGWLIVPDSTTGPRAGPLYFAVLEKKREIHDIRKRVKVNKYPKRQQD